MRERLTESSYSLAHSLLASLPVAEVATTNYDRLFETASEDAGRKVSVLPYRPNPALDRWLLKLHGCVTKPEDIVLTRSDYLRYSERRAALAGIVQALLITRHMLFVGFSLTDGNFHRIADEVRRAVSSDEAGHGGFNFGTALLLGDDRLLEELWQPDLACVSVAEDAGGDNLAAAARQLDIFLDLLLALGTDNTAHLLDESYDDVLGPGEKEVRERLLTLQRGLSPEAAETGAWAAVEELLQRFGADQSRVTTIQDR